MRLDFSSDSGQSEAQEGSTSQASSATVGLVNRVSMMILPLLRTRKEWYAKPQVSTAAFTWLRQQMAAAQKAYLMGSPQTTPAVASQLRQSE
jgi:hypothetical protein